VIDNEISIGYVLAIGDVDGNGKPDILLADKDEIVWYRNGNWQRFVIAENLTRFDNVCIAARDITGVGRVGIKLFIPEDDTGKRWSLRQPSLHRQQLLLSGIDFLRTFFEF